MTSLTLDEAVPAGITAWLADILPDAVGPFTFSRIAGGYSMLTYRVTDIAGHVWVLRHPPSGNHSGGAHDTGREARAMAALAATPVPVPRVRYTGTADSPLGLPCHITDFVEGYVIDDEQKARTLLSPDALNSATMNIVDTLATLHRVDPDEVGLGDLGPRANYLSRQMRRWLSVANEARIPETEKQVELMNSLGETLRRRQPEDTAPRIVHGDYRLGNAIVGDDGEVRALLDWELVTLGDPLADLGLLAAFWNPPAEAVLGARMPTGSAGSISLGAALDRYVSLTDTDLDQVGYYHAFACWRLAGTGLRAAKRYQSGVMNDDTDITKFGIAAGTWLGIAGDLLAGN
ncbi:aminoglycoside phosphotransferase (APT) family kinase protein [Jatrophihabitans sp. GAS493]|uniref:phosphotransferase family protein n=1 Tax=Jatrophihabitans sp. GAS493 TaxID=1907575 RepID=UPI000BC093AB|nr:phosphotransferase family protein [Jatrophihabitans sp. GAS493]SOD72128.1 aminoglycoside phosphotransferase (APT) family kinase protein [Jatrophihabitans sp. GAS493]